MLNDYKHFLVIDLEVEVDLAEFDEIRTIWEKFYLVEFETQWFMCSACACLLQNTA